MAGNDRKEGGVLRFATEKKTSVYTTGEKGGAVLQKKKQKGLAVRREPCFPKRGHRLAGIAESAEGPGRIGEKGVGVARGDTSCKK